MLLTGPLVAGQNGVNNVMEMSEDRFNGGSARIKHTPRHGIRHTGVMLVWACHYRGRDTRDLRDCRCNSCLYIMPPVLYGRTQTRGELP